MKAIGIILIVLFAGFILLAMILPAMSLHTEALYTRAGVAHLEELRLKAVAGDISQAVASLKEVVEFWPPKLRHEGDLSRVYELSRAGVIREIISRMRSLTGEDLGNDPKLWIEKFDRKAKKQANHALEPTPVGALSSAFAVGIIGPAWLSLGR
jgi:hypothetical protein